MAGLVAPLKARTNPITFLIRVLIVQPFSPYLFDIISVNPVHFFASFEGFYSRLKNVFKTI